jgi:O-antigen/teichoic acid export membrane protein
MSIKGRMLTSSLWWIAGTGATMMSSFVVFALMARFLQPVDFGLVAFAALFIDIGRGLMAGGVPDAMIRRKEWDEVAASTAFWLNLLTGIVFAAAVAAVATPLAYFYGSASLAEIFLLLSGSLVIDSFRGVHEAKLRRGFGYKVLAIRTVVASVISGIVGVAMAFAGFGVWALVTQRLMAATLQAVVVLWTVPWMPKLVFSRRECGDLFEFGINSMAARLVGELNARVASLVVGVILGPVALAFFRVASRTLTFLVSLTIKPIQTTAFSAFSRLKDAPAIGRAYVRLTRATALVSFPVFLGAAATAPDFVVVCFGRQWEASGPIMSILALVVAPATLLYFTGPALAALGRTRLILVSGLASLALNAIAALATVSFGVMAVAAGQAARAHVTTPFALSVLRRGVGLPIGQSLRSIVEPGVAAGLMAVTVVAARLYVLDDLSPFPRLAICVVLGAIVYACLLLTVARRYTAETMLELTPQLPTGARRVVEGFLAKILGTAGGSGPPSSPGG